MSPNEVGALAWGVVIGILIGYQACYRHYREMIDNYFKAGKQAMEQQKRMANLFGKTDIPGGLLGSATLPPQKRIRKGKGTDVK